MRMQNAECKRMQSAECRMQNYGVGTAVGGI